MDFKVILSRSYFANLPSVSESGSFGMLHPKPGLHRMLQAFCRGVLGSIIEIKTKPSTPR
jgi:hypothetical protein